MTAVNLTAEGGGDWIHWGETPVNRKAGVPVTYVGHPLADVIPQQPQKDEARAQLRLPSGKLIVALLPGSRRSELQYMAGAFVLAARDSPGVSQTRRAAVVR